MERYHNQSMDRLNNICDVDDKGLIHIWRNFKELSKKEQQTEKQDNYMNRESLGEQMLMAKKHANAQIL